MSESDKTRELMIKQVSNTKDIENDKIRELERRQQAEIRLLEKMNEALKKEKRDTEERLEDVILRQEIMVAKHAEEHHNTVKYFENIVTK